MNPGVRVSALRFVALPSLRVHRCALVVERFGRDHAILGAISYSGGSAALATALEL
jgi:hypothetical protein